MPKLIIGGIFVLFILNWALTPWYEAEEKKRQEEIARLQAETARLQESIGNYDRQRERREAQKLSDDLRARGIGISPAEAHALLKTEKELMDR